MGDIISAIVLFLICVVVICIFISEISSFYGKTIYITAWIIGYLFIMALVIHDHPWVMTRFDLMRTRGLTSAEGGFLVRIPRSWTFSEGKFLAKIPRTQIFREVPDNLSLLKRVLIRAAGDGETYINAARLFSRGRGRVVMFTEMSVSRVMNSASANLSAQELNDALFATLMRKADLYRYISVIQSEVKMLNGYSWAKIALDYHDTTYVFWQTIVGDKHYIIEFQTDNLSIAERTFEYIMESFSFRR